MAWGLAAKGLQAAWGLAAPWKHFGMKASGAALDFAVNDGNLSKGFLNAAKDALNGDFGKATEDLTGAVTKTVGNREQIAQNASDIKDTVQTGVTFAADIAEGKNPLASEDGEGGVGGLFNSLMSGDIFNMDNAKTAGKWGLGGFFLLKVFGWLKDSFSDDHKNDDESSFNWGGALTLAVVVGAGAFIYNKYGDDIKNAIGMDGDTPKTASVESAPKQQNLDDMLSMQPG